MDSSHKTSLSELKHLLEIEKIKLELNKTILSKYEYSFNRVKKLISKILKNKKELKAYTDSSDINGIIISKAHKRRPANVNPDYYIDDDPEYYMKIEPYHIKNEKQIASIKEKLDDDLKEWKGYSDVLLLAITATKNVGKKIENRINEVEKKSRDIQKDIPPTINEKKQDNLKNPNKGIVKRIRSIIKNEKLEESEKYTSEICDDVCKILKREGFEPVERNVYTILNREGINNEKKKRR